MNYYEHHIGDYDADTAHLSWIEDMAYTRLIRLYYRKELPIPSDEAVACRLVRAATKEQKTAVVAVLAEFFRLEADGWHQKRCDFDVARYQRKAEHNREVGKLGGRPKKVVTQPEPGGNPDGLFLEPKQNPLQTPVTSNQNTEEKKEKARKRATADVPQPSDVEDQTWADWLALRRGKRAVVSQTVLTEARAEADKAGIPLQRFLSIWCARGSQGLTAEWLKPSERSGSTGAIPFNRQEAQEQRNRNVAIEWAAQGNS